jgi:AcrR family transcriptional regulator
MVLSATPALKPRKTPMQSRSAATVVAIFEATIQVLLQHGFDRLTTTRVADRAGVSVGTLYQYFPNKNALLLAVLGRYLDAIASSIEHACGEQHGAALKDMMVAMCHAFIDAKTRRLDVSQALMRPATKLGGDALRRAAAQRVQAAVLARLGTTKDRTFGELRLPTLVVTTAAMGPVHDAMEHGATAQHLTALRQELVALCLGYLERISSPKTAPKNKNETKNKTTNHPTSTATG